MTGSIICITAYINPASIYTHVFKGSYCPTPLVARWASTYLCFLPNKWTLISSKAFVYGVIKDSGMEGSCFSLHKDVEKSVQLLSQQDPPYLLSSQLTSPICLPLSLFLQGSVVRIGNKCVLNQINKK